jgi:hypothetical protein
MKHTNEDELTTAEKASLDTLNAGPQVGEQIPVTRQLLSWLSGMTGTPVHAKSGAR